MSDNDAGGCPVCGDPYNEPLSGVIGHGQPLDVRDYTRVCFEHDMGHGSVYSYIHTEDHEWGGELLEFADQADLKV